MQLKGANFFQDPSVRDSEATRDDRDDPQRPRAEPEGKKAQTAWMIKGLLLQLTIYRETFFPTIFYNYLL